MTYITPKHKDYDIYNFRSGTILSNFFFLVMAQSKKTITPKKEKKKRVYDFRSPYNWVQTSNLANPQKVGEF
jgi:hypothetical protein